MPVQSSKAGDKTPNSLPQRGRLKRVYQGTTPFVGNLYDMLNDPTAQKAARYVAALYSGCAYCAHVCLSVWYRWSDDGMRVVLISVRELETALPKYFNHNNYRSLTKMMTAAGFRKVPVCPRRTASDLPTHLCRCVSVGAAVAALHAQLCQRVLPRELPARPRGPAARRVPPAGLCAATHPQAPDQGCVRYTRRMRSDAD